MEATAERGPRDDATAIGGRGGRVARATRYGRSAYTFGTHGSQTCIVTSTLREPVLTSA